MSRNEHPCMVPGRPWTASHSSLIAPALVEWLRFFSFHTKLPLSLLHFLSYSSSSLFSSNSHCSCSSSVQLLPHMLMCGATLHPPRSHDMHTHMLSSALATSMYVRMSEHLLPTSHYEHPHWVCVWPNPMGLLHLHAYVQEYFALCWVCSTVCESTISSREELTLSHTNVGLCHLLPQHECTPVCLVPCYWAEGPLELSQRVFPGMLWLPHAAGE